jgi:hypothetical protein
MTRRRWLALAVLGLFAGSVLMGSWWGYLQVRMANDQSRHLVVVKLNTVSLRSGNGSLYPRHPDLPQVNRGMEGSLLSERGGWVQVEFPGGASGWLPRDTVLID